MYINISKSILSLTGQRVNEIKRGDQAQRLVIYCRRDKVSANKPTYFYCPPLCN